MKLDLKRRACFMFCHMVKPLLSFAISWASHGSFSYWFLKSCLMLRILIINISPLTYWFFFLFYFTSDFFFFEMKIKDWNFKTDHLSELLLLLPHHNIFIYYYYYFGCTTGGMWVFGPAQNQILTLCLGRQSLNPWSPGKSPYHNINTLLSGNVL